MKLVFKYNKLKTKMQNYNQALVNFNSMDYKDKQKKVLSMLEILKDGNNIFQDLWKLLDIVESPSESILDMIHKVITKAMYSMQEKQLQDAVGQLE